MAGRERKHVNKVVIAAPGKGQKFRGIHSKVDILLAIEKLILVLAIVVSLTEASQIINLAAKNPLNIITEKLDEIILFLRNEVGH